MRVDPVVLSRAAFLPVIAIIACRSDSTSPSPSPPHAGALSITLDPPEVVFRWTTDRCADFDLPDGPAHPVRLGNGSLLLVDGDAPVNYVSTGVDFNSLKRTCAPALAAADSTAPDTYQNQEWIWAPYRVGSVIHALIHNEYRDPLASNCQP